MGSQIVGQVVAVPGLQWTVSDDDSPVPSGPLFWIYVDQHGRWCLRREGGETEAYFGSRAEAAAFLEDIEGDSPYRLLIETRNGKVILEQHGTARSARDDERRKGRGTNAASAAAPNAGADTGAPGDSTSGRGLAWVSKLESAARVCLSRLALLGRQVREVLP